MHNWQILVLTGSRKTGSHSRVFTVCDPSLCNKRFNLKYIINYVAIIFKMSPKIGIDLRVHALPIFSCRGNSQPRNMNIVTVYDIQNKFIGKKVQCHCT